jgi:hypothetical protein
MTRTSTPWLLAVGWFLAAIAVFLMMDASSTRSWLYLAAIAIGPPIALLKLWPETPRQTIDDVIHGRGGQS